MSQIVSAKESQVSNFYPFSYHEESYETMSLQHIYYIICWLNDGDCHKSSVRLLWLQTLSVTVMYVRRDSTKVQSQGTLE